MQPDYLPLEKLLAQGRSGGHPVATVAGQAKTWSDFVMECGEWKAALQPLGVKRIALYLPESWDFACALFGAWSLGLQVSLPGDALPDTCEQLRPSVDAFIGALPGAALASVPSAAATLPGWPKLAQVGTCLSVFTSGSTGKPEAFTKTFAQLDAELLCLEQAFGERLSSSAVLATVSHQHIYGLLFKVLWPLCAGRPLLSQTLFYPEEILAAARGFTSVALISSPAHLKRLPEHLDWSAVRGQWTAVFSSGGPLPWPAAELCRNLLGQAPLEIYGSSETGGVAWRQRRAEQEPWRPFTDTTVELEADSGTLRVRSPKLASADWFQTPDRAQWLDGGTFELLGRQDRILKIEEKRISLNAIEAAITGSGLVKEASVLPLPGERESLGAALVLSPAGAALDAKALHEQLRQAVAARVERVGVPKRWRAVEALPVNAQGKSTLADLQRLFEAP
jgi:acyl-coenzyme A synthetase/AMP-(fatty) acid ligase